MFGKKDGGMEYVKREPVYFIYLSPLFSIGACIWKEMDLGQVWCLIVLIPDLCPLSYF